VIAASSVASVLISLGLVGVGLSFVSMGAYRFLRPDWRESLFWRRHPFLRFVAAPSPSFGPASESFGGSLMMVGGAFVVGVGVWLLT
jgi:hypothetical protein